MLFALGVCPGAAAQSLRVGNGPEVETLDPQRARSVSAFNILRDLYEALIRVGADGELIPGAAEGWEVSGDGLIYRFHLRADARWSNGDAVTADDFVAGMRRTLLPATGSSFAQMLTPIRGAAAIIRGELQPEALGVRALSPLELEIQLDAPAPQLLGVLTQAATYPIHRPSLQRYGADFARAGRLIGNGAYALDAWVMQSHVSLRRNPYYWDAKDVGIDAVTYYPTEDINSEYKRYRAGELDVTYEVPPVQIAQIRRERAAELHVAPYLGVYYYGLNLTRAPFSGNPKLRQALSMAIDRKLIVDKVLNGLALPAYGWVPPGVTGYPPQQPVWAQLSREQQLAEARRLFAESGYGPRHPLELEIRFNTHESHQRVATVIAAMWKQTLGVTTRLVNEEFKVFINHRKQRRLTQVFRSVWIADYNDPSSFTDILYSSHGQNDTGWSSPAYDARIDAAREQPVLRTPMLQAAERLIFDEVPVIPIYFYVSKHLVQSRVIGWRDNVLDYHYTRDLRLEAHAPTEPGS
ncbi:peptide ABC transporter substrate-binding protein [Sinimarinibacterium sp. CAU 1509]|uniref:peptide ABC transporter substrate-binding protein n=1 Tax=Sinimarinibacterium sp. CAU 1509 TaxID=2562283 RepID=UPI00200AE6FF|nr:peptide ABC transporter substrate-binding protein [Sinimarinibacterium sp. CAU 1509]